MRFLGAGLLLILALPVAHAGDEGLAGNWKVTIYNDTQPTPFFWLLHFTNKDKEWSGTTTPLRKLPPAKVTNMKINGEQLNFQLTLTLKQRIVFDFEGKMPRAGGKKIFGTLSQDGELIPTVLEATTAKNSFDLDREIVMRFPNDPRVFGAVLNLLPEAQANKVPPGDVSDWIETALAGADAFGPRWKNDLTLKFFDRLLTLDNYAGIAVELGKKIDKTLDAKSQEDLRLRLYEGMAQAMRRAGQAGPAKDYEAKLDNLLLTGYANYLKKEPFAVDKFKGRKAKSKRAVLVELFTGGQCGPCLAADLAFDALGKAFTPKDVVLLQYHVHVPGPDALTNADTEARQEFYGRAAELTPAIFFNGKHAPLGGGGRKDAEDKFIEYRQVAEKLLEKPSDVEVQVSAVRQGDKITIQASAKNIENPGKDMRLRIALVEEWARYQCRNGMVYHHRVVRALPGGAAGLALTKKEGEKSVVVDLDELRKNLNKYLDDFQEKETPFPDAQRPLRLRDLHVVAFVQNDENGEILQAVDVAVKKSDE